jgi:hypothetical protein
VLLVTCLLDGLLNYFSTLKMEMIRSSETSGAAQRTTLRHIPEDDTLHNHRCENLKSYVYCHIYKTQHWSLTSARWIHSIPSHPISVRSILVLTSYICLGFLLVSFP